MKGTVLFALLSLGIAGLACGVAPPDDAPIATSRQAETGTNIVQILEGTGSTSWFGEYIATTGSVVAVSDRGAKGVYVFEKSDLSWVEVAKLTPPDDGQETSLFGAEIFAVDGYLLVRRTTAASSVTLSLFERTPSGWTYLQEISTPSAPAVGGGVVRDGATLIVSALTNVTVYEKSGPTFSARQTIAAPLARTVEGLALVNDRLLVGEQGQINGIASYARSASGWVFDERYPLGERKPASLCIAGGVLTIGTYLRPEALALPYTGAGFGELVPIPETVSTDYQWSRVVCDGERVAVLPPRYRQDGSAVTPVHVRTGDSWSTTNIPLGLGVTGVNVALSNATLFVRTFVPSGNSAVRVLTFGKIAGEACSASEECASRFCIDGMCCDSACGDGATNDCQACSRAGGAAADGKCGPVAATHVCREAREACDVVDFCDGTSAACPADLVVPNGTACEVGVCSNGACASSEAESHESSAEDKGGASPDSAAGCNIAPSKNTPAFGFGVLVAAAALGQRLARRAWRSHSAGSPISRKTGNPQLGNAAVIAASARSSASGRIGIVGVSAPMSAITFFK